MKQFFLALILLILAAPGTVPAASVSLVEPPDGYVLDPGNLLGASKEADLRRQLTAHAKQSEYALFFVIVEPGHQLDAAAFQTVNRWRADVDQILVVYPYGEPQGASLIWRPAKVATSEETAGKIMAACKAQGSQAISREAQLDKFVAEFCVQLHQLTEARTPVVPPPAPPEKKEKTAEEKLEQLKTAPLPVILMGVAMLGIIAWSLVCLAGPRAIYFPQVEISTRLGAPCGGGGQPVIRFDRPAASSRF